MPKKMLINQYEHNLVAMAHLLDAVDERHWYSGIDKDLKQWRTSRDTSHHLSAYGGMGSFNDVWICAANKHEVSIQQEPWVNTPFNWIKSICHQLAQKPDDSLSALELSQSVGYYDADLSAFVGGDEAPDYMRGLSGTDIKLQGWRCLQCGYSEASSRSLESLLADIVLPSEIFRACEVRELDRLVDQVQALKLRGIDALRADLSQLIKSSGIVLSNRDGWMRPCPTCSSEDTAVYRWVLRKRDSRRFIPSDDNLPMKLGKA